jgi:hypothetical protein
MFNKGAFINLGEDIYVYPNFVSENDCKEIIEEIESIPEEKWVGQFNEGLQGNERTLIWINKIIPVHEKIKSLLDENVYLSGGLAAIRMKLGTEGPHHSDNFEFLEIREASNQLKPGEDFDLAKNNIAGLIVYFNDFEGGEIYYSNQDVTYAPKAGDLVIHSSEDHCKHQVKKLKSEIRYSHSNNLFDYIKVPKGFVDVH